MLDRHLLNERYRIKETIGGGGMANVYLAKDMILERDVAIKMLRLEYANDEEFIARFHREAQSATSLNHPNIVNIYDVGEEDNILFMAMEYIDGMTLKEYIQQYGPIATGESLDIMKQISSAIAHAHENEIVHRDIKPQNILIDTYGQVKVTDFGIAVALSATSLTQTNSILGSVHYLSPEQARGGMATKKSDVYSLGIVLYELLTGRLPFFGQTAVSIALKHLQRDTPSVRRFNQDIPQSVENIVLKATAKDPFHRYQSVEQVEVALERALDSDIQNEAKYAPPVETGEETKAIPIITDDQADASIDQDTIVHSADSETKPNTEEGNSKPEEHKNKNRKKRRKWPLVLFIILLVLISGAVLAFFIFQPKEVAIPDISDMEYEDAAEKLKNANLQHEKELQFTDDVEEGAVIKSDPHSGKSVKENSTVTVFVSQGKEKSSFADYTGKDFEQTKDLLEEEGFDVIGYDKHSDKPNGEITSQIQPDSDEEVVPNETQVIFEYSSGPELTSLSNLKEMSEEEAEEYLEEKNFKMNTKEQQSDSVEKGKVIKQEPSPGTNLSSGETVDVYVSTGPEKKSPSSETIDFTVDYKSEDAEGDEEESEEQTVKVYIDDMNRSLSEVAEEKAISKDTDFTINLTIEPDEEAEYKVVRDDEVVINKTVPYEEGE